MTPATRTTHLLLLSLAAFSLTPAQNLNPAQPTREYIRHAR